MTSEENIEITPNLESNNIGQVENTPVIEQINASQNNEIIEVIENKAQEVKNDIEIKEKEFSEITKEKTDELPEDKNKGNQPVTPREVEETLQKLKPFLERGDTRLSALTKAKIPSSSFYDLMKKNPHFAEMVELYESYAIEICNSAILAFIGTVTKKLNAETTGTNKDKNGVVKEELKITKDDKKLIQWFLERRDKRYKKSLDITSDDKPLTTGNLLDLSSMSDEDLDDMISELKSINGAK